MFVHEGAGLSQQFIGQKGVIGYDNSAPCAFTQNSLTSVDQSGRLLGLQATRLLIERVKGRSEAEHFVVTPRVVARSSSARRQT